MIALLLGVAGYLHFAGNIDGLGGRFIVIVGGWQAVQAIDVERFERRIMGGRVRNIAGQERGEALRYAHPDYGCCRITSAECDHGQWRRNAESRWEYAAEPHVLRNLDVPRIAEALIPNVKAQLDEGVALGNWLRANIPYRQDRSFGLDDVFARSCGLPLGSLHFEPGNYVSLLGFAESGPDEEYADDAQAHAYDGGGGHDVSPKGGLPLGYKVLLVALVFSLFVASFCNAIRLVLNGRGEAGLPYLIVGVSGIFGSLIMGFPFVYAGP